MQNVPTCYAPHKRVKSWNVCHIPNLTNSAVRYFRPQVVYHPGILDDRQLQLHVALHHPEETLLCITQEKITV